jgi:hypothetical protein
MCLLIPNGTDPQNECTNGACNAGACDLDNGQSCTTGSQCLSGNCPAADGVCCDTACGTKCNACTMAKTGVANGTCAPVTADTDPDNECPGMSDPGTATVCCASNMCGDPGCP